jgi:hypothetical protein
MFTLAKRSARFLVLVTSLLMLAAVSGAQTKLCYTGNAFTAATSPFTTSDSISGCVTLNVSLPSNTTGSFTSDITSFNFTDGVEDFTSSNSQLTSLDFTVSSGVITQWQVLGATPVSAPVPGNFISENITSAGIVMDYGNQNGNSGSNQFAPGTWTEVSATPEPRSLLLLSTGILLVGIKLLRDR